jgi:hypothetical protein
LFAAYSQFSRTAVTLKISTFPDAISYKSS